MKEDVVVVTLEYRTGVLGFLSDETKLMPGNLGMTDVVLGLSWVHLIFSLIGKGSRCM